MAGLFSLPTELLLSVLSYCDSASLHSLVLTSRHLYQAAQTLLYTNVDLSLKLDQCTYLALTLLRRPHLAKHVQRLAFSTGLDLSLDKDKKVGFRAGLPKAVRQEAELIIQRDYLFQITEGRKRHAGTGLGCDLGDLSILPINGGSNNRLRAAILVLCGNLRQLSVTTDWIGLINMLPHLNILRNLQSLQIHGQWFPTKRHDLPIDSIWQIRSLRTLDMYGCDVFFENHDESVPLPVKSLGLHHCDVMVGDLAQLLLSAVDLDRLEYEWLTNEKEDEYMVAHGVLHFLLKHRSTLRHLSLTMVYTRNLTLELNPVYFHEFSEPKLLATFEKLEHLEFEYWSFLQDEWIDWTAHAPEQLMSPLHEMLPPSIESVTIRNCLGRVRQHLYLVLVNISMFPFLSRIHIEMMVDYHENSWDTLKKEFATRNITLTVALWEIKDFQSHRDHMMLTYANGLRNDVCTSENEWRDLILPGPNDAKGVIARRAQDPAFLDDELHVRRLSVYSD